jgi:hypothetical protein
MITALLHISISLEGRGRTDPEDEGLLRATVMEPVLLLRRKVKAFPFFQLQNLSPETKVNPAPEDEAELLPFVGLLFGRGLPFSESQEDRFQPPIRRTWNQELEFFDLLFLNGNPVFLLIDNLLFRGFPEKIGDILVEGLENLKEAIERNGGQVPFDLGDEPLGQVGPFGELLLGQVAELPEIPNSFPDLHRALQE